jgi:hypothetical protein
MNKTQEYPKLLIIPDIFDITERRRRMERTTMRVNSSKGTITL